MKKRWIALGIVGLLAACSILALAAFHSRPYAGWELVVVPLDVQEPTEEPIGIVVAHSGQALTITVNGSISPPLGGPGGLVARLPDGTEYAVEPVLDDTMGAYRDVKAVDGDGVPVYAVKARSPDGMLYAVKVDLTDPDRYYVDDTHMERY